MDNEQKTTHEVAVNAYLMHNDRFLLLKRTRPPEIWGPPGGRLFPLEDPVAGLRREVFEETGLPIKVFEPVTVWFGPFNGRMLLSIDYLCHACSQHIRLSAEHADHRWLTLSELDENRGEYIDQRFGFRLSDYRRAWRRYETEHKCV